MTDIAANLEAVRERIRNARIRSGRVDHVQLVAVTKFHPAAAVQEAARLGVTVVGENRVQEAIQKQAEYTGTPISWHLIGHLQRNKAAQAVRHFDLIESVDSVRILEAIEKQAEKIDKVQDILLQFNIAEEPQKYGLKLSEYEDILAAVEAAPYIRLRGLMCMAPLVENPEEVRPVFRVAYNVFDDVRQRYGEGNMRYLSMGMSNDMEVAIEEGANLVRVGTAIFGSREY